jgi:uncharacterized LabA/DUF88 family protein
MLRETIVFIEDKYLSLINKHFGNGTPLPIDHNQFAITLARSQGLWCKEAYLYTAPPFQSSPPTEEEAERKSRYDKFVSKMNRIPNFHVREGRCQKVDGKFKQKGVDTLITMDLFDAHKKNINTVILLTCDTDFVPILNKIRQNGMKVILFYFNDFIRHSKFSMSNHILTACDQPVLLTKEHFEKSLRRKKVENQTQNVSV